MTALPSHAPPRIVVAEVTRRDDRLNRAAGLLTSAPTGLLAADQFNQEPAGTPTSTPAFQPVLKVWLCDSHVKD